MDLPVTVVGEALIDIVIPIEGATAEHVGGSPANVAIGLSRLGHSTELATHIGTDARGDRIARLLREERVGLSEGSRSADRTPTATAVLDESGAATYTFDLDWRLADTTPEVGGHLHAGSIAAVLQPGGSAARALIERVRPNTTISYDPNARPSLMGTPDEARTVIEDFIGAADVVKASDEDLAWLYGTDADPAEILTSWHSLGPRLCILTRGGSDAIVSINGHLQRVQVPPARVVDTVGAGDSFMAGLLSGLLDARLLGGAEGRDRLADAGWSQVAPAVDRAVRCAAITVSRAGANPPTRRDLQLASELG